MKRAITILVCLLVLGASCAWLTLVPTGQLPPVQDAALGGAGGAGSSGASTPTKTATKTATKAPTATPTPTHLEPLLYGASLMDGTHCRSGAAGVAIMAQQDLGWSTEQLSPKYQTPGDGIHTPVVLLCDDRWAWKAPTTLLVSAVLAALGWPADLVPEAMRTQTMTVAPVIYGGQGENGKTCLGHADTALAMLNKDFALDLTAPPLLWGTDAIQDPYASSTRLLFCNDFWPWKVVSDLPRAGLLIVWQVLQALHWPDDLINSRYRFNSFAIRLLSEVDPATAAILEEQAKHDHCTWNYDVLLSKQQLNVCDLIEHVLLSIADGVRGVYLDQQAHIRFVWETPTDLFTQEHDGLLWFWQFSWGLVLTFLVAVIAWVGWRTMLGASISWLAYASILETLPRIVLSLIVAFFSKTLFLGLVATNNTFAQIFGQETIISVLLNHQATGSVEAVLQILYAAMALLFIIEEAARMAVLYVLFAFAPLLLFCAALRETAGIARTSVMATILFTFLQAMQLAVLAVGGKVIVSVLGTASSSLIVLHLLSGFAILYLTLMLFFSVTRVAFGGLGSPLGTGMHSLTTGLFAGIGFGLARATLRRRNGGGRRPRPAASRAVPSAVPTPPRPPGGASHPVRTRTGAHPPSQGTRFTTDGRRIPTEIPARSGSRMPLPGSPAQAAGHPVPSAPGAPPGPGRTSPPVVRSPVAPPGGTPPTRPATGPGGQSPPGKPPRTPVAPPAGQARSAPGPRTGGAPGAGTPPARPPRMPPVARGPRSALGTQPGRRPVRPPRRPPSP
jgi:hypothetical protein